MGNDVVCRTRRNGRRGKINVEQRGLYVVEEDKEIELMH